MWTGVLGSVSADAGLHNLHCRMGSRKGARIQWPPLPPNPPAHCPVLPCSYTICLLILPCGCIALGAVLFTLCLFSVYISGEHEHAALEIVGWESLRMGSTILNHVCAFSSNWRQGMLTSMAHDQLTLWTSLLELCCNKEVMLHLLKCASVKCFAAFGFMINLGLFYFAVFLIKGDKSKPTN